MTPPNMTFSVTLPALHPELGPLSSTLNLKGQWLACNQQSMSICWHVTSKICLTHHLFVLWDALLGTLTFHEDSTSSCPSHVAGPQMSSLINSFSYLIQPSDQPLTKWRRMPADILMLPDPHLEVFPDREILTVPCKCSNSDCGVAKWPFQSSLED